MMNNIILATLLAFYSLSCSENMDVGTNDAAGDDLTSAENLNSADDLSEDLQIGNLEDNESSEEDVQVIFEEEPTSAGGGSTEVIEISEIGENASALDTSTELESDLLAISIIDANAPFADPDAPAYAKLERRISDFDTKIDQCIYEYQNIFSAHIKDTDQCSKLFERMNKNKFTLVKRCVRVNFQENLSEEATDRLERVLPRSIERINRQYRLASLSDCNLGAIPDQSQVNYVFNSSVEIGELDGKWGVKDGSQIPGWSVRFYDKDKGVVEKKGLLEIQSNALYRKGSEGTDDKHYMELDSHCAKGYSCPTTNVSIRQKIIVDSRKDYLLSFEARMRTSDPADNSIEVKFYKKATKLADRTPLTTFVIISENADVAEIESGKSIPVSTDWEVYGADLGVVDPGIYFVEINEIGKANRLGSLLDNISINQN
jgi:hypothetical protein